MQHFVRSGSLSSFPELVREHGQNPSELLRQVGLSTAILHDSDLYIPYVDLGRLLELSAEQCQLKEFGVLLASRQGLEVSGALGTAVSLQADLGSAMRMLQQNLGFHARGARITVELHEPFVDIHLDLDFIRDHSFNQLQSLSAALLCRAISQLQNEELPPVELDMNVDAAVVTPRYSQIIGCPVRPEAASNRARFPLAAMANPLRISDTLRDRLNKHWRTDVLRSQPVSLHQQVERAITALLPTGECQLEKVSHIVGMHPRILQRKLKDANTNFGALLAKIRLRLACHYLQNSDIDVTSLAMNLGFNDVAAFSRVFKKWTKHSPRAWRSKAVTGNAKVNALLLERTP